MDILPNVRTHPWYGRAHHRAGGGFRNPWPPDRQASPVRGLIWYVQNRLKSKVNRLPVVRSLDPSDLRAEPRSVHFTWLGHATLLIRSPRQTILLDPIFTRRASPFSFAGPSRLPDFALEIDDLPPIDVVVLSHDHYDHMDEKTIRTLADAHDPLFLTTLETGRILECWGCSRVVELDWWQYVDACGARFHCVPAKHFSGRKMTNRDWTLWAGWYFDLSEARVLFAGDTGYAPHFARIRERLGRPDVAVIPIGAYLPRWIMQPIHVDPAEAIQAFRDLEARHFIPVHWGTFDLAEEALHDPPDAIRRLVRECGLDGCVHLLDVGQTWVYEDAHSSVAA